MMGYVCGFLTDVKLCYCLGVIFFLQIAESSLIMDFIFCYPGVALRTEFQQISCNSDTVKADRCEVPDTGVDSIFIDTKK